MASPEKHPENIGDIPILGWKPVYLLTLPPIMKMKKQGPAEMSLVSSLENGHFPWEKGYGSSDFVWFCLTIKTLRQVLLESSFLPGSTMLLLRYRKKE